MVSKSNRVQHRSEAAWLPLTRTQGFVFAEGAYFLLDSHSLCQEDQPNPGEMSRQLQLIFQHDMLLGTDVDAYKTSDAVGVY